MAVVELADANFNQEVVETKTPVLVDFYGEWCPPCKMAVPVLEELAKEYEGKIKFGKLNVDENPRTARKYGIMSIPTLIIFKEGKEIARQVGFPGKEGYRKLIDGVLSG